MKLPDKDAENYRAFRTFLQSDKHNLKTIKLEGHGAFSHSIMPLLRGFKNSDDIGHIIDRNHNVIAFSNGYLYDITTDDRRRVNEEDFVSRIMSIPYSNNIPDSKANGI